jgi:hypothetical protein
MRTVIDNPGKPTYYLAHGEDGTRHLGVVEPGQHFASGQPHCDFSDDPEAFLEKIKDVEIPDLPELPSKGQQVGLGLYLHNGERHVVAKTAHVRLPELPEHAPARFAVGKGRTS